ncbi:hypothetical protein [Microcoleus sp. OTE_8_concoct_300]|uniref:hypothetical protein n=1 Tax=Microcoleus sp. OTE_8_concoct_300 TaxID=2964710 RepID=UPI00403F8EA0
MVQYLRGTDFASRMLRQAQQKIADLELTNIKFEEADAEFLARCHNVFYSLL